MNIYNALIKGIEGTKTSPLTLEDYLKSLKPTMKELRRSYFNKPVFVPYHREDIQVAYLIAYLPHYYNLIYSILLNEGDAIFGDKNEINIGFIGGGPGSEVYGTIKYILNNRPAIKKVNIVVFDLNAETWDFSHTIVKDYLIRELEGFQRLELSWKAIHFDLTKPLDILNNQMTFNKLNLLVIQNCLNEIASNQFEQLNINVQTIFNHLLGNAFFLMADLTSGARDVIKRLEMSIEATNKIKYKNSTLNETHPLKTRSINPSPIPIIRNNLLNGTDGLIPRINLTYDYSLISKEHIFEQREYIEETGFNALYNPLANNQIDANNYVHTKTFIGIDFGTSNTVISYAVIEGEKLKIDIIPIFQKDEHGYGTESRMLPSVLALINNRLLVGKYAAELKMTLEKNKNCWYGFKENLRTINLENYPESALKDFSPMPIANAKDALKIYFGYIKTGIENFIKEDKLPKDIAYAISVPAGFSSIEKEELLNCMITAELDVLDSPLIDEPNAALINYLFGDDAIFDTDTEKSILIIDVGAGTVDVSLMRIKKGFEGLKSELLAVKRDGFIGGNFLDKLIAKKILDGHAIFDTLDEFQKNDILTVCEKLKVLFCNNIKTDKTVNYKLPSKSFSDEVVQLQVGESFRKIGVNVAAMTYCDFHEVMHNYWDILLKTIHSAINSCNISAIEIENVILTGGGGRNPYLKANIASNFITSNLIVPDNIQEHVARGASLHSFIFNCYGKNIITPISTNGVYINLVTGREMVFDAGISIPSVDKELIVKKQFQEERLIQFNYRDEVFRFLAYAHIYIEKIIVFFNQNQEIECELVTNENVIKLEQIFDNLEYKLITLNLD